MGRTGRKCEGCQGRETESLLEEVGVKSLGPEISCWICLDLLPHDICFPSGSGIEGLPEACESGSRSFKWKLGLRHILMSSWSSGDWG